MGEESDKEFENIPDPTPEEHAQSLGVAVPINASKLVADDTDRPVADNKTGTLFPIEEKPSEIAASEIKDKKWTPEYKRQYAREYARRKRVERKLPPDYSDLNGGTPKSTQVGLNEAKPVGSSLVNPDVKKRDYGVEAVSLFIPISLFAGKMLGTHWSVAIDQEKKTFQFTDEQTRYIASLARWLECEKFAPMNPRLEFIIQTIAYAGPKLKTDPTPEKLKIAWLKVSGWLKRIFKRKE